ncbi:hypothetical protein X986_3967 [Burkholderia pseudomallei]|uniref:DUF7940 domain-containing protein n=1 Tax=Burkholderia pseudomallei TaxID=28450 RepID=UPI00050FFA5E|nr:hypothetical protein [Burkholderia pseudomallei]AIV87383.1 hypothetical protein X995_5117 [Burkholderia pseudomallei B03]AIV93714.1 hypothetical protein X996_5971 [Burkholderia pseudomallei A79A]KGC50980.1 hypothetical protein DO66_5794 [Burkholderia pseudomallei]KGD51964.1 hypothetical protein DP49_1917 [Burkholderia pseudomallei]KGX12397.1 hypothetical protein X984_3520 [Burkholderia pseudomallei]
MKIRLIDEWRNAHKLGSVQLSSALAVVFGAGPALLDAWRSIPDDLKDALPHGWAHWIATGGFVLVLLARLLQVDRAQPAVAQGGGDGAQ